MLTHVNIEVISPVESSVFSLEFFLNGAELSLNSVNSANSANSGIQGI